MNVSAPHMVAYQEVYYETPNKRTGVMHRELARYVEPHELTAFIARVERQGGRVIRVEAPRQVETMDVSV